MNPEMVLKMRQEMEEMKSKFIALQQQASVTDLDAL